MACPSSAKRALQEILKDEFNRNKRAMRDWLSDCRVRCMASAHLNHEVEMAAKHGFIVDSRLVCKSGSNQAMLDIGNGYFAKAPVFPSLPQGEEPVPGKVYSPAGFSVITVGFDDPVRESYKLFARLAKEWPGINVVEHFYVRAMRRESGSSSDVLVSESGNQFAIVRDISEGGRFPVKDVEYGDFNGLGNGQQLRSAFESIMKLLVDMYQSRISNTVSPPEYDYWIHINGHRGKDGPKESFRKMFFLKIGLEDNLGELWLGDMDHVYLSEPNAGSRGAWG